MELLEEFNSNLENLPSDVYYPDDDSYLLSGFVSTLAKGKVLDVGCGNGLQSFSASTNNSVESVLGIDVNLKAIDFCSDFSKKAKIPNCSFKRIDYFDFIKSNQIKFDTILCNPPYLPTEITEKLQGQINEAFDGGIDGRKFIDGFLSTVSNQLTSHGQLLTIASSLSSIDKTIEVLDSLGFTNRILGQKSFFFEKLVCINSVRK